MVEFDIYSGQRRPYHMTKQCYKPSLANQLNKESKKLFTKECYDEFYLHTMKQFQRAKALVPLTANTNMDLNFRFQIKFGDVYFTNLPTLLLEESSLLLCKLRDALDKNYKRSKFDITNTYHKIHSDEEEQSTGDDEEPDVVLKDNQKVLVKPNFIFIFEYFKSVLVLSLTIQIQTMSKKEAWAKRKRRNTNRNSPAPPSIQTLSPMRNICMPYSPRMNSSRFPRIFIWYMWKI